MEQATAGHPQANEIRGDIIEFIRRTERRQKAYTEQDRYSKIIKNIKYKIKSNEAVVTMADKNAGLIIINKREYINKTETFFENNNYVEIKKNPTIKFHDTIKRQLKKQTDFLLKYNRNIKYMVPMNPKTPLLYSLIKLHKIEQPIRPIVSSISSTTDKISKFILNLFKNNINFTPAYTVKNRDELINSIQKVTFPQKYTLASFDIVNLYSNIPIAETLKIAKEIIRKDMDESDTESIMHLIEMCTSQNFCRFDDKFYQFSEGVPMGMSLSGLLADIFLNSIEKKLLDEQNEVNKNILYWRRYVDDILVVWTDSQAELDVFHNYLNTIHEKIKFTVEIEHSKNIKFLDLDISHNEKGLTFDIYRKPTQTDVIIPSDSHHYHAHKLAAFNACVHRLSTTPMSDQAKEKEIQVIKQIAIGNNFNTTTIDKVIYKHNKKNLLSNISKLQPVTNQDKAMTYKALTYPGKLAYQIKNIFKKYNITTTFRTNNTTKHMLFNAKDKIDLLEDNGVYKLSCNSCNATYIGETGRKLKDRITEHVATRDRDSHFGQHLRFNNHAFDINKNTELLHSQTKGFKLNLLEHYEINKFIAQNPDKQCLNAKVYTAKPPLYTYLKNPFPPPLPNPKNI